MDFAQKRGGTKSTIIDAFTSYYDLLNAKVPGVNVEAIKAHIAEKNYYLYEEEVKSFLEKNPSYQTELFGSLLEGAIAPGKARGGGFGGKSRISVERALEVLNNPTDENVKLYQELMTQAETIRKKINEMCSSKAKLDFALKSKKTKEEEESEKSASEGTDPAIAQA